MGVRWTAEQIEQVGVVALGDALNAVGLAASVEPVGLGNSVVAGQAAFWYSLMSPSHRSVRSTMTVAGGVSGGSSNGVGGRCSRERWGRWPL